MTTTSTTVEGAMLLEGLPRRRHLKALIEIRDQLARLATERRSHQVDDASDVFALMINVEDEIAALFPDVHAALFPRWITTVAQSSHEVGEYNGFCALCRAPRPLTAPPTRSA